MTVSYVLMDPTGNRTILVETPVAVERQSMVAARLMALEPSAEQAGFLSASACGDIALRMAGGEFCGNGTMSAAAWCLRGRGQTDGRVSVEASGALEPVEVRIKEKEDGLWRGSVDMPRPGRIESVSFPEGVTLPVVFFQGISHVIWEREGTEKKAGELAKRWCILLGTDALGLMFWNRGAGILTPLVYVPAADTLFWESACGSGSSAVGAWLARERGEETTVSLRQPGGVLEVCAVPGGPISLRGGVRWLYRKTAEIV